jgi:hypothetical protein
LQRTGFVADYQCKFLYLLDHREFLSLLGHCEGLAKNHQVDIFTASLHNPLKTDVELEHPETLEEAMALARAYEQRMASGSAGPSVPTEPLRLEPVTSSHQAAATSCTPTATRHQRGGGGSGTVPSARRFKQLIAAEMVAKRERSKCYNCTEPFSR